MLKIKNFHKAYKSADVCVDAVHSDARVVLLVGANGSGKSTLLKALAGLIDYQGVLEMKGSIMYAEELIRYPDYLTPEKYLNYLIKLGTASTIRMQWLIDAFDLKEHVQKPFKALSKGTKQKVHLVQAMMESRDVYLLDEPLSGLDVYAQRQLANIIKKRCEKFVIATHETNIFDGLECHKVQL